MATIQKSTKINFYKFVQVKEPSSSAVKSDDTVVLAKTINKNVEATNRLGSTLNSLVSILDGVKAAQLEMLDAAQERRVNFQADYTKVKKRKQESKFTLMDGFQTPSFLEGLFNFLSGLFKAAILIPALKWLSDPENREKVKTIVDIIGKVVKFIFDVAKFGVVNTIEGLYNLLKDDATWQERVLGFGQALVGIGTIVLGLRYLKNPLKIITDIGKSIKALINFATGRGGRGGGGGNRGGNRGGGRRRRRFNPLRRRSIGGPLPEAARGGWISGPQSGYRVSLDGGRSTSFIGHGTEYVARKANGGAFVVPFNTPGTKTQPHLTQKRLGEAKSLGFKVPGYSMGGKVPEYALGGVMGSVQSWWNNLTGGKDKPESKTEKEPVVEKGQDKKPVIGAGLPAVIAGGKWALSKGYTVAEHPNFRKNNHSGKGPNPGGYISGGGQAVGGHSAGSLHYKGLAIDITDWRPGAWKARTAQLAEQAYQMRDKMKLSQIIHDGWGSWFSGGSKRGPGNTGHPTHLHLGFLEGLSKGLTGAGSTGDAASASTNPAGGYGAILDLIGKRESDSVGGYNAVNQGGADGGHTALGYSGDYRKAPFNKSGIALTSMTVGQVMEKQYDDRSMSDAQWKEAGKLHAVGRYQIIGSTLKGLVDQGVVSKDDKFDAATQNKLGIALVKGTGGDVGRLKSTWIGLQHETDAAVAAAVSAGGDTTTGGLNMGGTNTGETPPKAPLSEKAKSLIAQITGGKASSSKGLTIGGAPGALPASKFQAAGENKELEKQTDDRNKARRQITEKSQSMIQTALAAIAQQNGVNSQAVKAAQTAVQMAMEQSNNQPMMVGGGGSAPQKSIASTLSSSLNPLRGILK